jgi:signal transduction histidine kinase
MKELHIQTPNLNPFTLDPILNDAVSLVEAQKNRREGVRLYLQDITFIDPYGLLGLWIMIRYLERRFRTVGVILPTDRDLCSYLRRMNFLSVVSEMARIEGDECRYPGVGRPSDVLLEMSLVEKQADVVKVTENILTRIGTILKKELQYEERDVTAFSTVVSEVCTNVFDHSEDKGMVAAQRYTQKDGTKFAIIAVADLGIGMRASLEKRYRQAQGWSHLQAIVNALQKTYSRHPDRGLGLFIVSKIVGEYRGSLHIGSGDARLYLRHRARGIERAPFPGTQVSITLSARPKKTLDNGRRAF